MCSANVPSPSPLPTKIFALTCRVIQHTHTINNIIIHTRYFILLLLLLCIYRTKSVSDTAPRSVIGRLDRRLPSPPRARVRRPGHVRQITPRSLPIAPGRVRCFRPRKGRNSAPQRSRPTPRAFRSPLANNSGREKTRDVARATLSGPTDRARGRRRYTCIFFIIIIIYTTRDTRRLAGKHTHVHTPRSVAAHRIHI